MLITHEVNDEINVLYKNKIIAKLAKTTWAKWKIIGEDVYALDWKDLIVRLENRQKNLNKCLTEV